MAKFVLLYQGGTAPTTPAEGEKMMSDWMAWFGKAGSAILDMGSAFGDSSAVGASLPDSGVNGYSVVQGDSRDAVVGMIGDHPHLASGGRIEVHDTTQM